MWVFFGGGAHSLGSFAFSVNTSTFRFRSGGVALAFAVMGDLALYEKAKKSSAEVLQYLFGFFSIFVRDHKDLGTWELMHCLVSVMVPTPQVVEQGPGTHSPHSITYGKLICCYLMYCRTVGKIPGHSCVLHSISMVVVPPPHSPGSRVAPSLLLTHCLTLVMFPPPQEEEQSDQGS